MKLEVLRGLFLQVVLTATLVETVRGATGYLGGSVTLASGADPTWNLSSIEWSIFTNSTWIATYREGEENIDRVDRYKGRLNLNTITGDLTIHKLTKEDNMVYTVELVNTLGKSNSSIIHLTVNRQLQQPTIQTISSTRVDGGCWNVLNCSSTDGDVDFSWRVTPSAGIVYNNINVDRKHAVFTVFLNTTRNAVTVTCTSRRKMGNGSTVITTKCEDPKPEPTPHPNYSYAIVFFAGALVGVLLTIIYFSKRNTV